MFKNYTFLKLKGNGANDSQVDSKAKLGLKFVFILVRMNCCPFLDAAPFWADFIVSVS